MTSPRGQEETGAPPRSSTPATSSEGIAVDNLRCFTRSPHPYHLQSRASARRHGSHTPPSELGDLLRPPSYYSSKSSRTPSDSGTEADDESTGLLRGLPAPPLRPRKGLRVGTNGNVAADTDGWMPSLHPWPPQLVRTMSRKSSRWSSDTEAEGRMAEKRQMLSRKRRVEVLRRLLETALLLSVGGVVLLQRDARVLAWAWRKELAAHGLLVTTLYAAYPFTIRAATSGRRWRLWPKNRPFFSIPSSFDPAPLLYPVLVPIFVALSLTHRHPALAMPNIILSLSSLPPLVVPLHHWAHGFSISHWVVTLIPIVISEHTFFDSTLPKPLSLRGFNAEALTLLFPLHQALIPTLDFLLTTSLLPAELELLTTALINLYLFAASPQAQILKALLWLGGMCVFISCRHLLRWEVALARIPSWKFRRPPNRSQSPRKFLNMMDHRICEKLSRACVSDEPISDSDEPSAFRNSRRTKTIPPIRDPELLSAEPRTATGDVSMTKVLEQDIHAIQRRRHSIATFDELVREQRVRTTPGGRRKKSMEPGLASFLSLTAAQAQVRKWLYALCVYATSVLIILGPIRKYVAEYALHGQDPFGWALGYLFGNLSGFRFWVLMLNFEYWIQLPPAWMRMPRVGLAGPSIFLSSVAEVDTRRKLFHGMMVLMFLPTVFVDPTFCAMALALVLAVFLLLDLFRASQLPPISRPLTYFLAPYVDGRDHRGPVIVSHIFLLIGCSIPLWLSLADLPRTGSPPWTGWDVPSRDVSMVSGVICVGMGDAAASLIGRRFGRLKWFWGGGKSLEGSVAFAVAVTCGLVAVRAWLLLGQWAVSGIADPDSVVSSRSFWLATIGRAVLAAGGTSATEAILTGCNDNVVVPVVLWLLVRGLGV
ncbi:hypothetical protein N7510_007433 [Penicillium lagena]|uniref:uncharacterized protein n=1 Tax=Penicillium lagena TaxID=94218 RepID=UPI00254218D3|nr:uncharacterized protein N7510_007433 [Penicillium lagena]KAJ5610714.1 hypothetical protein N7510_007433 [Penicillium lagena]